MARTSTKLAACLADFLQHKYAVWLGERNDGRAVLCFYSQDGGAPLRTRETFRQLGQCRKLLMPSEMLSERFSAFDGNDVCAKFGDGRMLDERSILDLLSAYGEQQTNARQFGWRGYVVNCWCFDRGSQSDKALRRLLLQFHRN